MRYSRLLFATVLLVASTVAASASSITYTETFTANGSLGGVSFTDQLVTLTGIGDTTDVTTDGVGDFFNNVTATVRIGSGSVDSFTDGIEVNDNGTNAQFADATKGHIIIDLTNAAVFSSYELGGAVSGTGTTSSNDTPFPTALGNLVLTDVTGDSTFSATLNPPVATTPEPSTFALLGTGILGLVGVAKRKLA